MNHLGHAWGWFSVWTLNFLPGAMRRSRTSLFLHLFHLSIWSLFLFDMFTVWTVIPLVLTFLFSVSSLHILFLIHLTNCCPTFYPLLPVYRDTSLIHYMFFIHFLLLSPTVNFPTLSSSLLPPPPMWKENLVVRIMRSPACGPTDPWVLFVSFIYFYLFTSFQFPHLSHCCPLSACDKWSHRDHHCCHG